MIKKILSIHGIGRFENLKATGDVTFGKYTLIFAENGVGKTTLCDIIKSLQTRVCGAWAHGKIHVMYQWLTNRRSCAHIYTCMPTWNYFPAAVSRCNKAQCMPTDRKLGPERQSR